MKVTERKKIQVKGKFLYEGNEKFYIKGVTYGTFKPEEKGNQFPERATIEKDFALMAETGINCVRTYTVPPSFLFDIAAEHNLKVMVGLPWEQHITFLDEDSVANSIVERLRNEVINCKRHPSILCYTIGNEIPSQIVRWYGKRKIEKFINRLYKTVKEADKDALITYVNYPTTEYLDLSFLDFDCFNVYLETPEKLQAYISRLHSLSGDRPLVLAEIGLDSMRNGQEKQAETLAWQIHTIFSKGCSGIFIFSWTDEWWRGGYDILDWDFGLVDRHRIPKPAFFEVQKSMRNVPVPVEENSPLVSVVVCTYNGSATIRKCIEGILRLNYPKFEVIVVNDGSRDETADIVSEYPVKLITTRNKGLSSARNTGLENSNGEIVAYIDDDAYPDQDWLRYLSNAFLNSQHYCIGGPNIAPNDSEFISTCVANAPGGPVHVMLSDEIAEHVPGCNMSFRRRALLDIGGFDPVYTSAGDDVDVCWRIQQSGGTIGFHPAALVWHLRRNSLKAYWKQQKGYGKAEALLEAKWPEKYNSLGHLTWAGRIYGNGFTLPIKLKKEKIYHGFWGTAPFQSVYQPSDNLLNCIPLMPEWYFLSACLFIVGTLGFLWSPLLWAWACFAGTIAIVIYQAAVSTMKNTALSNEQKSSSKYISLIILLHMIQPVARLYGRLSNGLTPWRKRGAESNLRFMFGVRSKVFTHWSETWKIQEFWLTMIENHLLGLKARIKRGNEFERWDFQIRNGLFGRVRALLAVEEHGAGKQFLRLRCRPRIHFVAYILPLVFAALSVVSYTQDAYLISVFSIITSAVILLKNMKEVSRAMNSFYIAFYRAVGETQNEFEIVKTTKIPEMVESDIMVPTV